MIELNEFLSNFPLNQENKSLAINKETFSPSSLFNSSF